MFENGDDGFEEDFDVQADGPVVDILGVEADNFFKVGDLAAATYLPHAGDAGTGGEAGTMMVLVFLPFIQGWGSGTYEGHISLEHIEELGKFIETGMTDKLADAGLVGAVRENLVANDAGVEVQLEHEAVGHTVLGHELFFAFLGVHIHGAELIHFEVLAVLADALLLEEDGAGGLLFDDWPDDCDDEEGENAAHQAAQNVHHPLGEELQGRGIVGGGGDDVEAVDFFNKAFAFHIPQGNTDVGGDGHLPALLEKRIDAGGLEV